MTGNHNRLRKWIADLLFPEGNACHLCGRFLAQPSLLCSSCTDALNTLQYKKLRIASSEPHPPLSACLSAYPHEDEARELVHLLKYAGDCALAQQLGQSMAAALMTSPDKPERIDAVVPVPLHASRLHQRGYNQALLLAQAVCGCTGLTLAEDALIRVHATDTQLHRDQKERMAAMRGAFAVPDPSVVRGRCILLVDDVLTTGATAMACAEALMAAGAQATALITACRR